MSRLTGTVDDERAALKEEIKDELRRDARRRKLLSCGGCLLATIVLNGIPTYFIAASLAKTGLVDVPVLSRRLYRTPEPVRDVIPLAGTKAEDLSAILAAKAKVDPRAGTVKLALSEVDLTTLISQSVSGAAAQAEAGLPIKDIQIALEPEYVEIFAVIERQGGEAALRARFAPLVVDGSLDLEIKEILLGSLSLPDSLAKSLATFLTKGPLDAVRKGLAEVGTIEEIALESKMLRVVLRPMKKR